MPAAIIYHRIRRMNPGITPVRAWVWACYLAA